MFAVNTVWCFLKNYKSNVLLLQVGQNNSVQTKVPSCTQKCAAVLAVLTHNINALTTCCIVFKLQLASSLATDNMLQAHVLDDTENFETSCN